MKIWIERCGETGDLFLHLAEPEPEPDEKYWWSERCIALGQQGETARLKKIVSRDKVAEFELKTIWERS